MSSSKEEQYFKDWKSREAVAESMLPVIGRLYRDHGVVTTVYGRSLVNCSVIDILKAHRFARQILENEISVRETAPVLEAMSKLELASARVDIGKLTVRYQTQGIDTDIDTFVRQELSQINTGKAALLSEPRDIVLYGFGRIGRLLARIFIEQTGGGDKLRLRAAVVRRGSKDDLIKRASLLRRDSVHGFFKGTIMVDEEENAIIANGNMIKLIYTDNPEDVDYTQYGIKDAILIDNTGKWRDREGLSRHLKAKGISRVVLTAPGKGDLPNVVYGVNNELLRDEEEIITAASCTTNAIVPVLKAVSDQFGIAHGHVETCHSYTNDQNLIDNYHNKNRRGRGAPLNMVITETGAAKAVAKALPELTGKLTGNAIRVPTPNVSMAILNLTLERETTVEELNRYLRDVSLDSPLQNQIDYTNSPEVVSSDFVGSTYAGVVDSLATIVNGERCVLYVWYDNEYGYSCQVVRMVEQMAGLEFSTYPR
ncbi:MAG: glyceraldehyde-3-phosphate dehydrogenase [Geoalkalibacter sp.]|jgi:glyceraldehyde 3-phosphate dehydrogenase|uniref:Glyceraldehyde-3-phosphate dehydrogenase n=1 Tax=Geoalkalibacter subterraneus TaxID=483547 RepID=A0A0B5FT50_9BACT|nr:glyceraldehyde-3-phosphate dehydrogenase [Geoalkalibacter subterraneus]AJF07335.1 glyceraldehyde-3-phosphate dehydrogenase [Geoalkalibacter subterraneus]MDY6850430.1 glyceraldehyde-3-phosphate dehydrogenase [Thermodesulfobacteriota bacterium]